MPMAISSSRFAVLSESWSRISAWWLATNESIEIPLDGNSGDLIHDVSLTCRLKPCVGECVPRALLPELWRGPELGERVALDPSAAS